MQKRSNIRAMLAPITIETKEILVLSNSCEAVSSHHRVLSKSFFIATLKEHWFVLDTSIGKIIYEI